MSPCWIRIKSHWPWCNFSFMTECRSDVNKLDCGTSRKKVGQVWLENDSMAIQDATDTWVYSYLSRCSVKKPPWFAFPGNWARFHQHVGMRFSLWPSYRWPLSWVSGWTFLISGRGLPPGSRTVPGLQKRQGVRLLRGASRPRQSLPLPHWA